MRTLLTSAVSRVEIYGVRPNEERGLLRTLAAVCEGRDVPTRVVFDVRGMSDAQAAVREAIDRNFRHAFKLEAYVPAEASLSMRALCVDGTSVLVTSGELHGSEDDAHIDLGVLVNDPAYIKALDEEWQRLLATGAVLRVEPTDRVK